MNGEVLLRELGESSVNWRIQALRVSVHEQMFRTGRRVVYIPHVLDRNDLLSEELLDLSRITQENAVVREPMTLDERLGHLHEALRLHGEDWYRFPYDRNDTSEMSLFTSMSLARLYEQGAPYLFDVEIELGLLYEKGRHDWVANQDLCAMYRIEAFRVIAEERMYSLWQPDLIWIAGQCGEGDDELIAMLRSVSAINSLEEADDQYLSAVLIGDRLMDGHDQPWKTRYWEITREAAGRWFILQNHRKRIDENYKEPDKAWIKMARKWQNSRKPVSRYVY